MNETEQKELYKYALKWPDLKFIMQPETFEMVATLPDGRTVSPEFMQDCHALYGGVVRAI